MPSSEPSGRSKVSLTVPPVLLISRKKLETLNVSPVIPVMVIPPTDSFIASSPSVSVSVAIASSGYRTNRPSTSVMFKATAPAATVMPASWMPILILAGAVSSTPSVPGSSATAETFSKRNEPLIEAVKLPTVSPRFTVPPSFRTSVV